MLPSLLRLGLVALGVAALADPLSAEERPNILLVFVDDLGWRDVGFAGVDKFVETPQLDSLRAQGMLFTQAYAAAGNCAPSRACLLSGQYGPRHGVYAVGDTDRGPKAKFRLAPVPNTQDLAPSIVTVAEALKPLGYATGHFGKWHVGSAAKGTAPRDQGFDVSPAELVAPGAGGEGATSKPAKKGNASEDPKKLRSITDAACAFITANKDRPFFAYVAHHAVHTPIQTGAASLEKFRAKAAGWTGPHVTAKYAACIFDTDAAIGRLLQHVDSLGLTSRTLVVFTSDNGGPHGQTSNEPLRGAKGCYYEGGIREPMLVRWPGKVPAGSTCTVPVINVDFFPTFVAAAGGTPAAALDGTSLLPLFSEKPAPLGRSALFWHFPGYLDTPVPRGRDTTFRTRPVTVIRRGDWKLHLWHEEWALDGGRAALATNRAVELYNLADDPGEHTDLSTTQPERRDELLTDLLAWMQRTGAPLARKK